MCRDAFASVCFTVRNWLLAWVSKAVDTGCIQSRYFSPHSLKMFKEKLPENTVKSSFPIFHNKIVSINRNLENVELLLDELDFHFDIIGISEKKKLQILMRVTPIRAFQVMFLSMCQHHWPLDSLDRRHWPLCWSISKLQRSWKNFKWGIPSPLAWNIFFQPKKHRLWNNLSSAQFAQLFPNVSIKGNRKNGLRWQGRSYHVWL